MTDDSIPEVDAERLSATAAFGGVFGLYGVLMSFVGNAALALGAAVLGAAFALCGCILAVRAKQRNNLFLSAAVVLASAVVIAIEAAALLSS